MNRSELLRQLPSVDDVLNLEALSQVRGDCAHAQLVQWIRDAIQTQRQAVLAGHPDSHPNEKILQSVLAAANSDSGQSIQRVINATGILLHTNLGRAPLAPVAIQRVGAAAMSTNVELDLQTGKRSKRGARAMQLLARLTGADDAVVVNNCAAATMLVLQAVALGREVIISRGQLVEIGGGFRLPNVFQSAGVRLREVGTTNRTYVHDYESAIGVDTGAIMRVHHSNFRLSGFVTEPTIAELVNCDRPHDLPVIDDVGSGCLYDLSRYGMNEPNVVQSVATGADLVLFSGDKLFGGPQAGIIVGKQSWIDQLKSNPMMRALRVDKMTLAALEATTEIHLRGTADQELPLMRMLCRSADEIRDQCQSVLSKLAGTRDLQMDVVESESQVGGGSVPDVGLGSYAIRIRLPHPDRLASLLRGGAIAIQARVADECVWLDLRTVLPESMDDFTNGLATALSKLA